MEGFFVSPGFREAMLKTYLSLLICLLPNKKLLHKSSRFLSLGLLGLTWFLRGLKLKLSLNKNIFYQKQLFSSGLVIKVLRFLICLIFLLNFLFIGPHTSVLANWEEKVIPDNKSFVQKPITDQVIALEIPKFKLPVEETYISTYFSRWHQGIDLPKPAGSPIQPIAKGVVIYSGWSSLGYGNMVVIRHELGYESLYAHLAEISVTEGDLVEPTSVIGKVGATGLAFGNHLHLEIHQVGAAVNPLWLLD